MRKVVIILGLLVLSNSYGQSIEVKKVFDLIDKYYFKYPDLIKKQFLLETSHASSEVFLKNNNGFGMRLAAQRRTTALYSKSGYAVYRSVQSSIVDRMHYDMKYMSKLSRKQYLKYLNSVYSDGKGEYIKILTKIDIEKYNK